ncbi:hypothetical protein WJX84_012124 [Apatococcus fuscideae]|uniref:Uncharacterized protein n=1 Tax=Apatococcus fuscideae TaxID=2026836 RepID=A0AAW1SS28_9CHLO
MLRKQHGACRRQHNTRQLRAVAELTNISTTIPDTAPYVAGTCTHQDLRKHLVSIGWARAWIDGIIEAQIKRRFDTSIDHCQQVVDFLTDLGVANLMVCNMAAAVPEILGLDVAEQLKPVVDYLAAQGVSGQAAAQLLQQHPKLLLYTVLSDGSKLQRGQARASVDVVERNGAKFANVNYWREGAAFNTAPLTPWKPSSL